MHGLLLTGGTSVRMGAPKAQMAIAGRTLAQRAADALCAVADPVLAVGIDAGLGLPRVDDPQRGPLVAFRTGWERLVEAGCTGPVLLLGCDLPMVTAGLLDFLADRRDGFDAAVPVRDRRPQPLAACYAPGARTVLKRIDRLAMRDFLSRISVNYVGSDLWRAVAPHHALLDVNTPQDLAAALEMVRRAS